MQLPTAAPSVPRSYSSIASLSALILLFLAFAIQKIWDLDLWWQIRTGQWIAANHAVPTHDIFSYTATDHPWIEMRWLYCLLAHATWSLGGPTLLILAKTAVLASCFLILIWDVKATARTPTGILVLALAIAAAAGRFVVRPELITFLCLCAFLVILDRRRTSSTNRPAWSLAAIQILWVNAHTLFVLGPVICLLRLIGDSIQHRRTTGRWIVDRGLLITTAAVSAACLINPYGLRGAAFPLTLWREIGSGSILGETISEFRSPFSLATWSAEMWACALLTVITSASFAINRRRLDVGRLLVFLACLYLAFISQRNVALLAFVSAWAILRNLAECRVDSTAVFSKHNPFGHATLALILTCAAWYVATDRLSAGRNSYQEFGLGIVESNIPASAAKFMVDANVQGNLFHSLGDGSYLVWAGADKLPVFVDGRLEVYGEAFIRKYYAVPSADWDDFADRHAINSVLIGQSFLSPLIPKILASPKWVLVYLDAARLVFVRDVPAHAAIIARYRIDPKKPWQPRSNEPDESLASWQKWIGCVKRPWHSLGMAETFLMLGGLDNAKTYLEQGLSRFPDHPRMSLALAAIRRAQERDQDANALTSASPSTPEDRAWADRLEMRLLLQRGRNKEAADKLVAMLRTDQQNAELHAMLGRVRFNLKQYLPAAESFRRAAVLSPDTTSYLMDLAAAAERCDRPADAVNAYRLILLIDPQNPIAEQRLSRLSEPRP